MPMSLATTGTASTASVPPEIYQPNPGEPLDLTTQASHTCPKPHCQSPDVRRQVEEHAEWPLLIEYAMKGGNTNTFPT